MVAENAVDDPRLSFVPFDRGPQNGDIVVAGQWWIVHPERGLVLFSKTSYQCNSQEGLARRLAERLYPWSDVRFVETAFIPHDCHDWAR